MADSAPSAGGRRIPRLALASLALTAALVLTIVAYWWLQVRPWVVEPDESAGAIAKRWEAVTAAAAVGAEAVASDELLLPLRGELRERDPGRLARAFDHWQAAAELTFEDKDALVGARPLVERLVSWSTSGGGLGGGDPCTLEERLPAADLYLVGRVALAITDVTGEPASVREPRLVAALRLGRAMRRGGPTLHVLAGVELAGHALGAARRSGSLAVLRAHAELAPESSDLWRAASVDAVCVDRQMEAQLEGLLRAWPAPDERTLDVPRAWITRTPAYFERERRMLRAFYGELLGRAGEVRHDAVAFAKALALPEDPDDYPPSFLVRAAATDISERLGQAAVRIGQYAEALAK